MSKPRRQDPIATGIAEAAIRYLDQRVRELTEQNRMLREALGIIDHGLTVLKDESTLADTSLLYEWFEEVRENITATQEATNDHE